jgi:hypothetical protein
MVGTFLALLLLGWMRVRQVLPGRGSRGLS